MYIKLLLEKLFKDLFLENNVNYYYFQQLCAYTLYLKHKVVIFKPKRLCALFGGNNLKKDHVYIIHCYKK